LSEELVHTNFILDMFRFK